MSKELAGHDGFLTGVLRYDKGRSPYHYHTGCEHFYLLLEGEATLVSEQGRCRVRAGHLVFIPEYEKHQPVAEGSSSPVFMEFQDLGDSNPCLLDGPMTPRHPVLNDSP